MPVETDDREFSVIFSKFRLQRVQIGHDSMIDELRCGHIDDDTLRILATNDPLERDPSTENCRLLDRYCRRVATHIVDGYGGFEQRAYRCAVQDMNDGFHQNADPDTDKQIGRKDTQDCRYEDDELLAAHLVHVFELLRRCQSKARKHEHRGECRERYPINEERDECYEGEQKDAVEHVCEPCTRAVINIRFASYDFGDHRETTDECGEGVADTYREEIFVEVSFAAPGIDLIDGLCAQERLETSDQRKHHDVFDADRRKYAGEVREGQRTKHVNRDVHKETRSESMILSTKRNDLFAADIEIHPERHRNQEHKHGGGNDLELRIFNERESEHDKKTDATDQCDDRIHFQKIAGYRRQALQRGSFTLETKHDRNLSGNDENTY